jgi:ribosomal protein S18 acetylase RimI-like enzyme
LTELRFVVPDEVVGSMRGEIEELWRQVFPSTTDERFDEILPRHAQRRGFRFLAARTAEGDLAGFAYGYEGGPGEWWHDHVAGAMDETQRELWLTPGHFEFVELQVRPGLQGRGIGRRLHDALLDGLRSPTAVLSTQVQNERARGFYERCGWETVLDEVDFGEGFPTFTVLGKNLA